MKEMCKSVREDKKQEGRFPYLEPQSVEIEFELENNVLDVSGNLPDQPGENWDN